MFVSRLNAIWTPFLIVITSVIRMDFAPRLDVAADKSLPVKSRIINPIVAPLLVLDRLKLILMKSAGEGCHLM